MADGLNWFTSLDRLVQKLSAAPDAMDGEVGDVIEAALKKAAQTVRERASERYLTGAMYDSVGYNVKVNGRGRHQGEYGYINNAPFYTKYQEKGTKTGIKPLMALNQANRELYNELSNKLREGRWMDII